MINTLLLKDLVLSLKYEVLDPVPSSRISETGTFMSLASKKFDMIKITANQQYVGPFQSRINFL